MARVALNKSSLNKLTKELKTYKKFLPSLELKRKQIIAERNKARRVVEANRSRLAEIEDLARDELPMLAAGHDLLQSLVRIDEVHVGRENIVGIRLPVFEGTTFHEGSYSFLTTPFWLDRAVALLREAVALRVQLTVDEERLQRLEYALQKTTQRVNLFDKVLIPRTQESIRKIKIFLSDMERAEVVRAKISKAKTEKLREERV